MENERIESDFFQGCLLGGAVGNALGVYKLQTKKSTGFDDKIRFGGLMQMALFTAEGLLRAIHRAKMHGTNGTFAEIIYESYQRWLKTQRVSYNDLVHLPQNDGWLVRRSELYHKSVQLKNTVAALKVGKPGDWAHPLNHHDDFEGVCRVFPVGLMFPGDIKSSFKVGAEACALTHGGREAVLCAGLLAAVISGLVTETTLTETVSKALTELQLWPGHEKVQGAVVSALYFLDDLRELPAEQAQTEITQFTARFGKSIQAQDILAYSIFSLLYHPDDFRAAVETSLMYEAAPQATGMIVGAVAGLINGLHAIPAEWSSALKCSDIVLQIGSDLLTGIKGDIYTIDKEWAEKYPGY